MAQKPGPNRSQELEEISKSIQMTMEILTSVKDTLLKALDDTPVCPTYNQESPPLDWGSTQTPTLSDNEAWGAQIDTKQPKTKAKGQKGKGQNPRSRSKGAKGYNKTFRCFRCNLTGHNAAQCKTDWAKIQQGRSDEKKQTKTYQKSKQEETDND